MSQNDPFTPAPGTVCGLARPHYEVGKYLATEDLRTEQQYRLLRLRRHNRYAHGRGRVCGLRVVPAQDAARPWGVLVCPGYALTCCGDEIEVCKPAPVDIYDYRWSRPEGSGIPVSAAFIGIRFVEEPRRPIAAQRASCQCEEVVHASRLRDGFQVDVLWDFTVDQHVVVDICANQTAPCPHCDQNPYILLAYIDLPSSEGQPITLERIHNFP